MGGGGRGDVIFLRLMRYEVGLCLYLCIYIYISIDMYMCVVVWVVGFLKSNPPDDRSIN